MNELTNRLTAAAEEMTSEMTEPDYRALRERVQATSRRLAYRRAAAVSVTALAVILLVVVGGMRLLPQAHQAPAPLGPLSPAPSSAPARVDASPTPARTVPIPGTLVYLAASAGKHLEVTEVTTAADAKFTLTGFGIARDNERVVIPSPDGNRVAVISSPNVGNVAPGDLVVIESGGARHILAQHISWGGGVWPLWTLDSRKIMVKRESGGWQLIDASTGTAAPLPGLDGEYFAWSPSGTYRAYAQQENTIVVARPDGTVTSRTPLSGLAECHELPACPFAVQAVSDDGRFVALGHGNTDPSHVSEAHLVLDTRTGRRLALPKVDGDITRIFFRPDGGLVLSWDQAGAVKLSLIGPDLKVTATIAEPANFRQAGLVLVGYRP